MCIRDSEFVIGAMARHRDVLEGAEAGQLFPILHDAERVIADPIVRNRGTVGGSICQADPSEDLSAVFAALGASAVIQSSSGKRVVSMDDFHRGAYSTAVGPAEMLVEVRIPIRPNSSSAYEKVERRAGDWAIVAAGAVLSLDGEQITHAGIGLAAVGAEHFRAAGAEEFLQGKPANEAVSYTHLDVSPVTSGGPDATGLSRETDAGFSGRRPIQDTCVAAP